MPFLLRAIVLAVAAPLICGATASAQQLSPDLQRLTQQQQMSVLMGWVGHAASLCRFGVDREMLGRIVARFEITQQQVTGGGELVHYIDEGARNANQTAQREGQQAFCANQWRELGPGARAVFFTEQR